MNKKLDFNKKTWPRTPPVIQLRLNPEIIDILKLYATLNHTTTKALISDFIYETLEITAEDQKISNTCVVCGKTFLSNNNVRKFCSSECRKKNNLALRKAWEFKNRAKDENLLTPADILEIKKTSQLFLLWM